MENEVFCNTCKVGFASEQELNEHNWSLLHHKNEELSFTDGVEHCHTCNLCEKSMDGFKAYIKHIHGSSHKSKENVYIVEKNKPYNTQNVIGTCKPALPQNKPYTTQNVVVGSTYPLLPNYGVFQQLPFSFLNLNYNSTFKYNNQYQKNKPYPSKASFSSKNKYVWANSMAPSTKGVFHSESKNNFNKNNLVEPCINTPYNLNLARNSEKTNPGNAKCYKTSTTSSKCHETSMSTNHTTIQINNQEFNQTDVNYNKNFPSPYKNNNRFINCIKSYVNQQSKNNYDLLFMTEDQIKKRIKNRAKRFKKMNRKRFHEKSVTQESKFNNDSVIQERKFNDGSVIQESKFNDHSVIQESKFNDGSVTQESKFNDHSVIQENNGDSVTQESKGDSVTQVMMKRTQESNDCAYLPPLKKKFSLIVSAENNQPLTNIKGYHITSENNQPLTNTKSQQLTSENNSYNKNDQLFASSYDDKVNSKNNYNNDQSTVKIGCGKTDLSGKFLDNENNKNYPSTGNDINNTDLSAKSFISQTSTSIASTTNDQKYLSNVIINNNNNVQSISKYNKNDVLTSTNIKTSKNSNKNDQSATKNSHKSNSLTTNNNNNKNYQSASKNSYKNDSLTENSSNKNDQLTTKNNYKNESLTENSSNNKSDQSTKKNSYKNDSSTANSNNNKNDQSASKNSYKNDSLTENSSNKNDQSTTKNRYKNDSLTTNSNNKNNQSASKNSYKNDSLTTNSNNKNNQSASKNSYKNDSLTEHSSNNKSDQSTRKNSYKNDSLIANSNNNKNDQSASKNSYKNDSLTENSSNKNDQSTTKNSYKNKSLTINSNNKKNYQSASKNIYKNDSLTENNSNKNDQSTTKNSYKNNSLTTNNNNNKNDQSASKNSYKNDSLVVRSNHNKNDQSMTKNSCKNNSLTSNSNKKNNNQSAKKNSYTNDSLTANSNHNNNDQPATKNSYKNDSLTENSNNNKNDQLAEKDNEQNYNENSNENDNDNEQLIVCKLNFNRFQKSLKRKEEHISSSIGIKTQALEMVDKYKLSVVKKALKNPSLKLDTPGPKKLLVEKENSSVIPGDSSLSHLLTKNIIGDFVDFEVREGKKYPKNNESFEKQCNEISNNKLNKVCEFISGNMQKCENLISSENSEQFCDYHNRVLGAVVAYVKSKNVVKSATDVVSESLQSEFQKLPAMDSLSDKLQMPGNSNLSIESNAVEKNERLNEACHSIEPDSEARQNADIVIRSKHTNELSTKSLSVSLADSTCYSEIYQYAANDSPIMKSNYLLQFMDQELCPHKNTEEQINSVEQVKSPQENSLKSTHMFSVEESKSPQKITPKRSNFSNLKRIKLLQMKSIEESPRVFSVEGSKSPRMRSVEEKSKCGSPDEQLNDLSTVEKSPQIITNLERLKFSCMCSNITLHTICACSNERFKSLDVSMNEELQSPYTSLCKELDFSSVSKVRTHEQCKECSTKQINSNDVSIKTSQVSDELSFNTNVEQPPHIPESVESQYLSESVESQYLPDLSLPKSFRESLKIYQSGTSEFNNGRENGSSNNLNEESNSHNLKMSEKLQSKVNKQINILYKLNKEREELEKELEKKSKAIEEVAIKLQNLCQQKEELRSANKKNNTILSQSAEHSSKKSFEKKIKECLETSSSDILKKKIVDCCMGYSGHAINNYKSTQSKTTLKNKTLLSNQSVELQKDCSLFLNSLSAVS